MGNVKNLHAEDNELIQACKRGNQEAFNKLVLKYQDRVFNTMARLIGDQELACDLTQETFINAYKGLGKFRETASFFTWLFRIGFNLVISARRKKQRYSKNTSISKYDAANDENQDWIEPVAQDKSPEEILQQKEKEKFIQEAIASLEEPFKSILVLRDIEGFSYEEIQEILECPIGTVRSRLHRARSMMKDKLKDIL